jgi:hypothetical protein
MRKQVLIEIICSLLILLFLYTGLSKLYAHASFSRVLHQSPILADVSTIMAWMIPLSEITLSFSLIFQQTRLVALYASLFLLSAFTAYLIYITLNYEDLPCHCGGVIGKMSWQQHIVFNCFFIVINVAAVKLWKAVHVRVTT